MGFEETHYYSRESLNKLAELAKLKPELFKAFRGFDQKVFEEGALSPKYKELIAIGVAHTTRCPYCIYNHVQKAKKAGASEEEIAEAIFVAVAMNAGASFAHSCIAMDSLKR